MGANCTSKIVLRRHDPKRKLEDGVLFAPLAFFLPETMPFLDTDLQTKSHEELASLKVALADLPVPLLSRFWAVLPPAAYSFTASMPRMREYNLKWK
ncbi:unnamed protein product [Sphenostylis stenocarpa]|uniref:Uncharacterized protein n=1 Tax=Sphenostylis stenocarpa TaxID=92480 RepID=A0AA86T6B0_9FABA|nr:unnamed protein product [Sphenostylis stenocarpa]